MSKQSEPNLYKSTFYTATGSISNILGNLISISILARVLSEYDFGIYTVILVLVGLFEIFAGLGLENGIVRFVTSKKEIFNEILIASLIIRTITLFLTIILLIISNHLFPKMFGISLDGIILFIILISVVSLQRDTLLKVIQGLLDFKVLSLNQILTSLTRLITIIIVLWIFELNIQKLLLIEFLIPTVSSLFLLFNLKRNHFLTFRLPNLITIKELLAFSLPLYFNNFFNFFYGRVNVIILAKYLNPISAAFYDISGKVPDALKRLFDSYMTVFYPHQVKNLASQNTIKVESTLNRSIVIFSWLMGLVILFYTLFEKFIIEILFSTKYIDIGPSLGILLISLLFRITANLKGYTIVATGKSNISMIVNFISTFVGLVVVFSCIKKFDFLGAALGVLSMNVIADILYTCYIIKFKLSKPDKVLFSILGYMILFSFSLHIFIDIDFLGIAFLLTSVLLYTFLWRNLLSAELKTVKSQLIKIHLIARFIKPK